MSRPTYGVLGVLLLLASATAAFASMGYLTVNSASFDSRTFEYGGHVSYQYSSVSTPVFETITHNNTNCGSGECGGSPQYLTKCRITAGSTSYSHELEVKVLKGTDVVFGPDTVFHSHSNGNWLYNPGWFFPNTNFDYTPYVFKVSIWDDNSTPQEGSTVQLN